MALTILDAQEAAHSVAIEMEQEKQELVAEWLEPVIAIAQARTVEQVLVMWEQFPPEVKAMMERKNPEQYAQIVKRVDELKQKK